MKKISPLILLLLICFLTISLPQEVSAKSIQLKDGSVIKGTVVGFANGTYTIHTENLGEVKIEDNKIQNISEDMPTSPMFSGNLPFANPSGNSQMTSQVQGIQSSIMADPQSMQDIQQLVQDPDIQKLLSDPSLLQAAMTHDPEQIQKNPAVSELLKNPKIQMLLNKMMEKFPTGSPHSPAH